MPIPILAIAALAAQAASAAGVGRGTPGYNQINPLTDEYYQDLLSRISQVSNQMNANTGAASSALRQSQAIGGQMAQTTEQLQNQQAPDAMSWFNDFMSTVPEYQAIAQNAAQNFTEQYGRNLQQQTQQLQSQAVENAAAQFGGQAFSGAANAAVGQAAAAPLAQAQTNLVGTQSQLANQTFNNLAGQGQQLAYQGNQAEFTNTLNQLGQILGAQQAQAGIQQGAASGYTGLSNQFASLLNSLYGAQGQIADPIYQAAPASDPLGNLAQILMGAYGIQNMMGSNAQMPSAGSSLPITNTGGR